MKIVLSVLAAIVGSAILLYNLIAMAPDFSQRVFGDAFLNAFSSIFVYTLGLAAVAFVFSGLVQGVWRKIR